MSQLLEPRASDFLVGCCIGRPLADAELWLAPKHTWRESVCACMWPTGGVQCRCSYKLFVCRLYPSVVLVLENARSPLARGVKLDHSSTGTFAPTDPKIDRACKATRQTLPASLSLCGFWKQSKISAGPSRIRLQRSSRSPTPYLHYGKLVTFRIVI
jgi:hypothetical protein